MNEIIQGQNTNFSDELLILSQNDYYYNLVLRNKSTVVRTNFAHMHTFCDYENIFFHIKNKKFKYVIIDSITEPVLNQKLFDQLFKFLELNYDKEVYFFNITTKYPRYKNLSQSKKEYLYIFSKNANKQKEINLDITDQRPLCNKFGKFSF